MLPTASPGSAVTNNGPSTASSLTVTDVDGVALGAIARRLGSLVQRSRIQAESADLQATISIGGTMARPGDTAATICGRADAALYRAKAGGRNRAEMDLP